MWQVAVAAAVAGSGLLAKHLFNPNHNTIDDEQQLQAQEFLQLSINPAPSISPICEQNEGDGENDDGIFRFCSSGSPSNSKKSQVFRKKNNNFGCVRTRRRGKKIVGRFENECSDQRKGFGKRVSVCLKRRKIGRSSCGNQHSSFSKDCSSFGLGLGLGMIYMMSAGKAEVCKLSSAINETAKVVHELKSEFHKRDSSGLLLGKAVDTTNAIDVKQNSKQASIESGSRNKPQIDMKDINHLGDSEYASSVLSEEHLPECAEMDLLEAELESELQKLHLCADKSSAHEGTVHSSSQIDVCKSMDQRSKEYHSGGVSPTQLKNKLSQLLLTQQENHIFDLKSELNLAYSKLQEKETELRALKDCVRHLTEVSISTVSDEETEACREEELQISSQENEEKMELPTAIVGRKRSMGF